MKIVNCYWHVKLKMSLRAKRGNLGFALIYVLVMITIILISITSILTLGLSDLRQKNKVLATAGAYQMAESGIEDGIARYQKDPINKPEQCYNVGTNSYTDTSVSNCPTIVGQGSYSFKINADAKNVRAMGYYKGSQIGLQANKSPGSSNDKWDIFQVGF